MREKQGNAHILYLWLVLGLATWQLVLLFPELELDKARELLLIILLGVLAEWLAVPFPHGQLSGSYILVLSVFLIHGPAAAAWVGWLATLLGQGIVNRGNPLRTTLFNSSQYVLAVLAASHAFSACGGEPGLVSIGNALPLGAFTITYIIINHLLVHLYLLPKRRPLPGVTWLDTLKWDGLTYLYTVPLGLLVAMVYQFTGLTGLLVLFVSVLGLQVILRYYVQLQVANQELTSFYEAARFLEGNPGPAQVLEQVLKSARKAIPFHSAAGYLQSGERGAYYPVAAAGSYSSQIRSTAVYLGEGLTGTVLESGKPELIDDSRSDPRVKGDMGFTRVMRSLLVVPLYAGQEALGLVVLGDKRPYAFDEKHLHILAILCGQAAISVENTIIKDRMTRVLARDPLTGLLRFDVFNEKVEKALASSREEGYPSGLALVDIDNFKRFNKSYGRKSGERLLAELGSLIEKENRRDDLVARYGGDEFILFFPGARGNRLHELAEDIRYAVRDHAFLKKEGRSARITVSIGIAEFPQDAGDAEGLFKAAQRALEKAQEQGGDRVETAAVPLKISPSS
ncbi:MAG TPA: sensor domain-containing diguanylate cyclase [Bacillota bacterium]|nr:sensor domain-containing diguanylate cyclase [Peptococcaceae bacterium MAG4]NLW37504.1 GGDEF domain-containing protein [Peptococcaceae bacterium]HPZ43194.1 sensor domain-containing diguanylate cyclase [Bacillota bacterium]HQD75705.1 sensor domain-containing diguanylate cyclase [Bacillota bacterium]HUM58561.1 sensor domain-containing diguanylate cyclase [Bacillota bacterium]